MTTATDRESTPDWTQARRQPKERSKMALPKNIYEGKSSIECASVDGVRIARLSVEPAPDKKNLSTYAVVGDFIWHHEVMSALPRSLTWQQSFSARWDFTFDLPKGTRCLGLGERFSGLNLRGGSHTLCATDNEHHDEGMDAMYKSIPFLILSDSDDSVGLFLDCAAPQRWHLDNNLDGKGRIELFSRRGWDLYLIGPTTVPQVVRAYTQLTGRTKLPPRWALGYFQSRWSYPDEESVRQIAKECRARKIPCDSIVLDIDYMDEYKVFTVSKERFPNFDQMVADLAHENIKVVTIVDPGIKEDVNYSLFQEATSKDLLLKTNDGKIFLEKVWPGISAFPDFLKKETREWWAKHLKFYLEKGVAGIWNDMNEPAFFGAKKPLPEKMQELPSIIDQPFVHQVDGDKVPHLEVRNLYGSLMCQATYDGLLAQQPDKRPFILTRSAYAGIQRHAATWTGDNKSFFEHMAKSIPMLLNIGLSGVPFCGADVGGFGHDVDFDLLVRWYELGIFYPFFRNHAAMGTVAQEPWMQSPAVEAHCRKLIETRYRLLPYLQVLFWEHLHSGAPIMRPIVWHFPNDEYAPEIDDQFFFGGDILVVPILERGRTNRLAYFPRGLWHPFEGGSPIVGGKAHIVEVKLGSVPAFVRDGALLPLADVMQSTAEYNTIPITFTAFGDTASGVFFEDDGESFNFERKIYNEWALNVYQGDLRAKAMHRMYEAPKREYFFLHKGVRKKVTLE
jgi:alpha-glucosidase